MQGFKFCILLAICLCILLTECNAASRIDPLVQSNVGLIRGLRSSDGKYSMFMGIPYATVDKENPFGASVPYPEFEDVFSAFHDSAICPQVEEFNNTVVGSLDCLHLNIYVPNTATSSNRLPVLVWIHGGGFTIGFSGRYVYGPSYLVRHDVILVTLNYRLGPYGFFCLDTPEVPGNQALKDQLLALKWIKNNIESFGGDTDKITIFGESAGGASVDLHLHYNEEKLYNQIILQSGTAMAPFAVGQSDRTVPIKIAEYLGFSTDDTEEALSFLSSTDTKLVIAATVDLGIVYQPCVEKVFEGVESFLTEHPIHTPVPRVQDTAILIGHNNDEGITHVIMRNEDLIHDYLQTYLNFDENNLAEMEILVKHFYMGDNSFNDEQSVRALANFDSDFLFCYPQQVSIDKYFENGANTIFQYMFSYNGERNFVKERLNISFGGAAHADEMSYLFDVSYLKDEPSAEDQKVIDQITTLWTNFVKYGNPTPETSDLLPVIWEPVTDEKRFYLNIDSELTLESRPFHDRMAFWKLFYQLNTSFRKGYNSD